jgi:hypothetical protein
MREEASLRRMIIPWGHVSKGAQAPDDAGAVAEISLLAFLPALVGSRRQKFLARSRPADGRSPAARRATDGRGAETP